MGDSVAVFALAHSEPHRRVVARRTITSPHRAVHRHGRGRRRLEAAHRRCRSARMGAVGVHTRCASSRRRSTFQSCAPRADDVRRRRAPARSEPRSSRANRRSGCAVAKRASGRGGPGAARGQLLRLRRPPGLRQSRGGSAPS